MIPRFDRVAVAIAAEQRKDNFEFRLFEVLES